MPEKYLKLNAALKPSKEAWDRAIALSQSLGDKYAPEFILDGANFYPHITVYFPLYPEKNIDRVVDEVGKIAKDFSALEMKYAKIATAQGWIGAEFEYTDQIRSFHQAIVSRLSPFREDYYDPKFDTPEYRAGISQEQSENILKYGRPDVISLYHPHLTIIRLKDQIEAERVAREEVDWDIPSFHSDTVSVYKMGDHGTCVELIKEFKLG